jgi:hypothetical protein
MPDDKAWDLTPATFPFPGVLSATLKAVPAARDPLDGSALFARLEAVVERMRKSGAADAELASALRRLVHSPLVAVAVRMTPNKVDDFALAVLKELFPA